jgi:hypothetical protein
MAARWRRTIPRTLEETITARRQRDDLTAAGADAGAMVGVERSAV